MPNIFDIYTEEIPIEKRPPLHQSDIPAGMIKQRHCEAWVIFSGLDANKPTTDDTEKRAYWATDTHKLYIWDGSTWRYSTFT